MTASPIDREAIPGREAEIKGLGALSHHAGIARVVARFMPLARDAALVPLPVADRSPENVEAARRLDRALPSEAAIGGAGFQLAEASDGKSATVTEIATVLPIMLATRMNFRPERSAAYIAGLLELLKIELVANPFSMDVFVLAMLTNLRTSKFTPEAAELFDAIDAARRTVAYLAEEAKRLLEVRYSVDDVLIEAGLKVRPKAAEQIPWDDPSSPTAAKPKSRV